MNIDQHTFLITGASSGLGLACAQRLSRLGGNVVMADVDAAAGEAAAAELGTSARFVATDVCDPIAVQHAVRTAVNEFGALHGAVSCAGLAPAARLVGRTGPHDLELFERVVRVNLIGTFNVLRLAAAAMSTAPTNEAGERGVIVNTASIAAFEGQIGQTAYAASKAGVVGLTLPAARELARFGIRVVAIAPGIFETPLLAAMTDEVRASLAQQVPFPPRLGQPDEFAALVQHIFENAMLNGSVLRLDGAMRMEAK